MDGHYGMPGHILKGDQSNYISWKHLKIIADVEGTCTLYSFTSCYKAMAIVYNGAL